MPDLIRCNAMKGRELANRQQEKNMRRSVPVAEEENREDVPRNDQFRTVDLPECATPSTCGVNCSLSIQ